MNKKTLIGLAVIIIIGVGAYMLFGKGGSGGYGPATTVPVGGGSTSLQGLVAAGAPVTCTFSTTTASGSSSGTIFIANGMVAGDFVANDKVAGAINAHMIVRDQLSYVWTSMSNQGFKSNVTASATTGGQSKGIDYSAQMNYACQAWKPDTTKFNLPTNISFTSTAGYMAPAQGAGATGAASGGAGIKGTAVQCAACQQLPSNQKAQCLAALSCQ